MPRKPRLEYPGAIYHVMNRGDRREAIFKDDRDRERFLATAGERVGRSHYGAERQETGEARAERLVRTGLQALGWGEKQLTERRKGDKGEMNLARRLRAETTMTLCWIADRLRMGSWYYVSNWLREKP
jgi:hypothetical protein